MSLPAARVHSWFNSKSRKCSHKVPVVARRKIPMRVSYLGTVPAISLLLASPVLAQMEDTSAAAKLRREQPSHGGDPANAVQNPDELNLNPRSLAEASFEAELAKLGPA
jgi:hypothetical protein